MHFFKIWSRNRDKKALIGVNEDDIYVNLVLKASQKLQLNGSSLVIESDGTPIDADEALIAMKQEILILLQPNEEWIPPNNNTGYQHCPSLPLLSTLSTATTETLSASNLSTATTETYESTSSENEESQSNCTQSSGINIQIIDCNLEYLWTSFEIPWHKIPADMIQMCETGRRDKSVVTEIVHIVVNEMRQIKDIIPSKAFKTVAYKMISKYPQTFQDVDEDGIVYGDGACTLKSKLQERYNYLKRPHKRGRSTEVPSVPQLKKQRKNAMVGCTQWSPVSNQKLSDVSSKELLKDATGETLCKLLEETYPEQRQFINNDNPPDVNEIKKEWPILFDAIPLKWHFKKLTDINIEILSQGLKNKAEKIVAFGIKNKIITTNMGHVPVEQISLEVLAKYFKEDFTNFLQKVEREEDVKLNINEPCLVEIVTQPGHYYIYMEQQAVITCDDFLEAVNLCFALYFVFNLQYPKPISTLCEMIQRYYLKIHPDSGSKSKKTTTSKRKVLALMNKLRDL